MIIDAGFFSTLAVMMLILIGLSGIVRILLFFWKVSRD